MRSKHTPGPWEWVKDDWNGGYSGLAGPDGAEVLYPSHCNEGDTGAAWFPDGEDISEADFRLIAAAPELLAACELAFSRFRMSEQDDVVDALIAAIARARGGDA